MSTRDDRAYHAALAERRHDEHLAAVMECAAAGSELFSLLDDAAAACDRPGTWHDWADGDAAAIRAKTKRLREFLKAEGLL